jgi:hypothetical protein
MKFVIDRSKWICGGGVDEEDPDRSQPENVLGRGDNGLYNELGFMCVMGQILHQIGVPKKKMLDIAFPSDVLLPDDRLAKRFAEQLSVVLEQTDDNPLFRERTPILEAININDEWTTTVSFKEQELARIFAKEGHELVFVDKLPKKRRKRKVVKVMDASKLPKPALSVAKPLRTVVALRKTKAKR